MEYSLSTQHIEVSDWDREQMEKKLGRLQKHLLAPFHIQLHFAHDTHHANGEVVTCKLLVDQPGDNFRVSRAAASVQDALDESIEAIGQELAKAHDKRKDHRSGADN